MARSWPKPDAPSDAPPQADPVTATGTDTLPPAGDAQRDLLRERLDRLEAKIAEMPERGTIDPAAFEIDREIAQHLSPVNLLEVSHAQAGFRYKWIHTGQHSYFVKWANAQGWEIVTGDDPESRECKDVTGARRIGDVILMRIPEDRALKLDRAEAIRREAQKKGTSGSLEELVYKYRDYGARVHTDFATMNPQIAKAMQARGMAASKFEQMVRSGTVPGMPAPRGG